jgi:hypothetical protein
VGSLDTKPALFDDDDVASILFNSFGSNRFSHTEHVSSAFDDNESRLTAFFTLESLLDLSMKPLSRRALPLLLDAFESACFSSSLHLRMSQSITICWSLAFSSSLIAWGLFDQRLSGVVFKLKADDFLKLFVSWIELYGLRLFRLPYVELEVSTSVNIELVTRDSLGDTMKSDKRFN